MNVLLIGSGAREHALANLILKSPRLGRLWVAPGNAGTAEHNVNLNTDDHGSIVEFCSEHRVDLVVVGPEAPLVAGLADSLIEGGIACFGPSAAAARLEGSKSFARAFAARRGIPQPEAATFSDSAAAIAWLDEVGFEVVVKADGLAAGKGVVIPDGRDETIAAIRSMLDESAFGDASATIVVEERIDGQELSLFGVSDGQTVLPLLSAQDHKRVGEGDTGPNTGGMGAFAPVPGVTGPIVDELAETFLTAAIEGMAAEGTPFVGVLFAGIMLTADGPRLVEYNCRFGDPEAEVILPLIESDGLEMVAAAANATLADYELSISTETAATVVVAADGYPASPTIGVPVMIPDRASRTENEATIVHHGGTARDDSGNLVSSGGRVLAVTGIGADLDEALIGAYSVVAPILAAADGALFARRDIGWRHSSSGEQ